MLDIPYSLSFLIYLCTVLGKGTKLQNKRSFVFICVFINALTELIISGFLLQAGLQDI